MAHQTLTQPLSRLSQPSVVLDYDSAVGPQTDGIQLQCWMSGVQNNTTEGGDAQTFCNQYETTWVWTVKMTWELYALLKPLEFQEVAAATLFNAGAPVSMNNMEASMRVLVPAIPIPIAGDVRSIAATPLEFIMIGEPVVTGDPLAAVTTHPV